MSTTDLLVAPIAGSDRREVGGIELDIVRAGACRVKRLVFPPGFRWSTHMKPVVGTDLCMHAHVGFLARGEIAIRYGDGCTLGFTAPQVVTIEPGHDAWVVGLEPAVLIEFDFEGETANRPRESLVHSHAVFSKDTKPTTH